MGAHAGGGLEERVDHALASGDVLLVVGDVGDEALPSVAVGLLLLVDGDDFEVAAGGVLGEVGGVRLLQAASQE